LADYKRFPLTFDSYPALRDLVLGPVEELYPLLLDCCALEGVGDDGTVVSLDDFSAVDPAFEGGTAEESAILEAVAGVVGVGVGTVGDAASGVQDSTALLVVNDGIAGGSDQTRVTTLLHEDVAASQKSDAALRE
jgi:hypothetical protein